MKKSFTKLSMFLIAFSILSVLLSQSSTDFTSKIFCHNASYFDIIIAHGDTSDYPPQEIFSFNISLLQTTFCNMLLKSAQCYAEAIKSPRHNFAANNS